MVLVQLRKRSAFRIAAVMIGALLAVLPAAGCAEKGSGKPVLEQSDSPEPESEDNANEKKAGEIKQDKFYSDALGKETGFAVYLPPGYDQSIRYAVLYMYYGYGGHQNAYFSELRMGAKMDELIAAGQMEPLIVVTPSYGNSFGVDTEPGQGVNPGGVSEGKYMTYLTDELTDYVDSRYSTIADKSGRYIGGISMGGFASLHIGFSNPELFSKVGAHSAALWDYSDSDQFHSQRDWLYPSEELRRIRDPLLLAESQPLGDMKVYIDCGESDLLASKSEKLHAILQAEGVASELHIEPGGHNGGYWSGQLNNYLMFYGGK